MPLAKVRKQIPGRQAGELLFDLFSGRQVEVAGFLVCFVPPIALPEPVVDGDVIRWTFKGGVKVKTPGPDCVVTEIVQSRDQIKFSVGMWATITLELV